MSGSSPYTNDGKAKPNGGSGFAMTPDNYGQDWEQVKPQNGSPWGESSADQYTTHPFVGDNPPRSGSRFNSGDDGRLR